MPPELVFIHGWGFDAGLWDDIAARLKQFKQSRVDLGFFGNASSVPDGNGKILVGHSFGFVHGMQQNQNWSGWIAINSFPRFVETKTKIGCTSAVALRDIRLRLQLDPGQALKDFHEFVGATPPTGEPNAEHLRDGLDELRDADVEEVLKAFNIPGLALAGGKDVLVPKPASEALGRMAKRGGLKLHEQSGHILPQTAPDWCAQAIAEFVTACFDPA